MMKKRDIIYLAISLLILIIACSVLSMTSVAEEYRYSWVAMNPWNGVEGIAFTIGYFLKTSNETSLYISLGLLAFMWWRLYLVLKRTFKR